MTLVVKNPPTNAARVLLLHQDDPLEEGVATLSSIPAWRSPWTEESMGLRRAGQDWAAKHTHHVN